MIWYDIFIYINFIYINIEIGSVYVNVNVKSKSAWLSHPTIWLSRTGRPCLNQCSLRGGSLANTQRHPMILFSLSWTYHATLHYKLYIRFWKYHRSTNTTLWHYIIWYHVAHMNEYQIIKAVLLDSTITSHLRTHSIPWPNLSQSVRNSALYCENSPSRSCWKGLRMSGTLAWPI